MASYYLDNELGIHACQRSDEGLVVVDRLGSLRLFETGPMQLQRSLDDWMAMVGQGMTEIFSNLSSRKISHFKSVVRGGVE